MVSRKPRPRRACQEAPWAVKKRARPLFGHTLKAAQERRYKAGSGANRNQPCFWFLFFPRPPPTSSVIVWAAESWPLHLVSLFVVLLFCCFVVLIGFIVFCFVVAVVFVLLIRGSPLF